MRITLLSLLLLTLFISCQKSKEASNTLVKTFMLLQTDSLQHSIDRMIMCLDNSCEKDDLQKIFSSSREHYKRIEGLVEFHFPGISKAINGPAILKTEEYDDNVILPTGFQIIEEHIFPYSEENKTQLQKQLKIFSATLVRLHQLIEGTTFTDSNIFEATRLNILRIISLGITGFDSPVAFQSLPETTASLQGMEKVMHYYVKPTTKDSWDTLLSTFGKTIQYLKKNQRFNEFDRAEFITQYLNNLSVQLLDFQKSLNIPNNKWMTAVDMEKKDFFTEGVFRVDYFAPGYSQQPSEELISLGKTLFFDPVLSGNNSRSCASCHIPQHAFTDGKSKSMSFNFEGEVTRNAPTLINSGFQQSQFWDQRVHFLEDQISTVIASPSEMHGQLGQAIRKIKQSDEYVKLFMEAFNEATDGALSERNILTALATYIRSLNRLNSRFDQYMRGNGLLDSNEIAGFNLFMGKAKCGTCHFAPLFNGTVPPLYTETESEVLGVPLRADTVNAVLDTDLGKFNAYGRALYKHAFKTPTVRNASLTGPYMHNGVYHSLEEVIDFYNQGGAEGIGIELSNQTLPPDKLELTEKEKQNLVAFIQTLTDTTGLTSRPSMLPLLADSDLNSRKVGGDY